MFWAWQAEELGVVLGGPMVVCAEARRKEVERREKVRKRMVMVDWIELDVVERDRFETKRMSERQEDPKNPKRVMGR